ncbi:hypothetical protein DL96DRAFT_1153576 [Flagelloscypha sp. PMI_526]|nr:hypothetical protein DL96DRAFT_1153576 [Flagelloscypha sp. PMI_526]
MQVEVQVSHFTQCCSSRFPAQLWAPNSLCVTKKRDQPRKGLRQRLIVLNRRNKSQNSRFPLHLQRRRSGRKFLPRPSPHWTNWSRRTATSNSLKSFVLLLKELRQFPLGRILILENSVSERNQRNGVIEIHVLEMKRSQRILLQHLKLRQKVVPSGLGGVRKHQTGVYQKPKRKAKTHHQFCVRNVPRKSFKSALTLPLKLSFRLSMLLMVGTATKAPHLHLLILPLITSPSDQAMQQKLQNKVTYDQSM